MSDACILVQCSLHCPSTETLRPLHQDCSWPTGDRGQSLPAKSAAYVPVPVKLAHLVSAQMGSDLPSGREAAPRTNGVFVNTHSGELA